MGPLPGDGLRLVQGEQPLPAGQIPAIAVYPRPVEVDLLPLSPPPVGLRRRPSGVDGGQHRCSGAAGSTSPETAGSISTAHGRPEAGHAVNLYQTIQPRGLRFLLDGESFCGLSQDWRELEGALEVLASVLSGLSGAGVDCSLSLPHSRLFGPMTVSSGEGGGDDLLFYLAGYRCLAQRVPEESRSPQGPAFLPSRFAADAAPQSGTAYLITCSGSRLPAALVERLDPGQLWVLCAPGLGRSPPGPGSGPSPWTPCGKGGAAMNQSRSRLVDLAGLLSNVTALHTLFSIFAFRQTGRSDPGPACSSGASASP